MTWTQGFFYLGYMTLFIGSVAAMLWWHQRQRKRWLPFGSETRLLRAPGETQLQRVRAFDDKALPRLMWAAMIPATAGLLLFMGTTQLPQEIQVAGLAITLGIFLALFIGAARWYAAKQQESHNRYLGYFGERLVAENLEPLKPQGWRVFHDVPAEANGHTFNLDHVIVGSSGVHVIETKTRRKGIARPGFEPHKVYFDGQTLVWPWGEDNHGLEQAERHARWLADTLQAELGERVAVGPILALPGWWVELKPTRTTRLCRVINPKALAKMFVGGEPVLAERQVAAIVAKLEARCRDVAF